MAIPNTLLMNFTQIGLVFKKKKKFESKMHCQQIEQPGGQLGSNYIVEISQGQRVKVPSTIDSTL